MKVTKSWRVTLVFALLLLAPVWVYLRFPVYDQQKVTNTIEHNIPVGTNRVDVVNFLESLHWKDVEVMSGGEDVVAYFPDRIFMRGWWYIRVNFTFKNGQMTTYEMTRIKI